MSKLAIVVTAAVCIPLGAVLTRPASAQMRASGFAQAELTHFGRAQHAMHEAWIEIEASSQANEPMWNDAAGHAVAAMGSIEAAMRSVDRAAAWASDACNPGAGFIIATPACRRRP